MTHLDNLFIFSGAVEGKVIDKCFVVHIQSSEVEPIMNLEKATMYHTLHHMVGMVKAYICGGRTTGYFALKDVLEFDILN